jgi:N-hydroxyarylamine O-acetyltransferase
MQAGFDLDLYLSRIGYDGPTKPDLATLSGLLAAHMNAIPFENIDVLLGRPIRLDLESLQKKIVADRRGGYCFEQATLFLAALPALGFEATPRTARVILVLKAGASPRGRMYIVVRLPEGEFVADPGLGGMGCRTPIPLDGTPAQEATSCGRSGRRTAGGCSRSKVLSAASTHGSPGTTRTTGSTSRSETIGTRPIRPRRWSIA